MKGSTMRSSLIGIIIAILYCACSNTHHDETDLPVSAVANQDIPAIVDYNLHIKPILSDRCFACHGPDQAKQKGGLALHTAERAYAELKESPGHFAIVPKELARSEVIKRILSIDAKEVMPPVESNLVLNDYEKRLISKWIEQGAVYKQHWSLIAPQKPGIPNVKEKAWVRNPIDNFILAKQEQLGLVHTPEASKEKLLRRVTFDITGLPPTLQELDDFLNDMNENAYEKVIDRLLASPAYGERMASRWLDIARYSDSHGYQDDFYRSTWPWREWVIKAHNTNLPYDQFVTWQLAGDLLPDATYEQKLATGFNRNHAINQEVGIIDEEYRTEYVADRTNTIGAAFIGLTLECARCHDHKYDPISQKEYYQLFSFFNNVEERGFMLGDAPGPAVKYPQEDLDRIRNYVKSMASSEKEKMEKRKAGIVSRQRGDKVFNDWLSKIEKDKTPTKKPPLPVSGFSFDEVEHRNIVNTFKSEKDARWVGDTILFKSGKYGAGAFLKGYQAIDLGNYDFVQHNKPFSYSFWNNIQTSMAFHFVELFSKATRSNKGFHIRAIGDYIIIATMGDNEKQKYQVTSTKFMAKYKWNHIAITYDGSGTFGGFAFYLNGKNIPLTGDLDKPLSNFPTVNAEIGHAFVPNSNGRGLHGSGVDEVSLFNYMLNEEEVSALYQYNPVSDCIRTGNSSNAKNQQQVINEFLYHNDPEFIRNYNYYESLRYRELDVPSDKPLNVMVMQEKKEARKTYILKRGAYDAFGDEVHAGTPQSILSFSDTLPQNRLGLARWLFDAGNPLTARVAVNHYWEYFFGRGLVKSLEDFGNQGDLPSHPELLDWLSVTFRESGWDVKAFVKLIVMSSVYREDSKISEEHYRVDQENKWLARGSRYRMPVEMIRDQVLEASGLLVKKIGGPSVRPYMPEGLWSAVTGGGGGPISNYFQDREEDLYRRSVYTFWKRTVPHPVMLTFDAATRDRCVVKRQSTNTPLQALVLLNDPQFMEAARVMAQNLIAQNGNDPETNISSAFRKLTARTPKQEELNGLIALYQEQLDVYKKSKDEAQKLISIGEYRLDTKIDVAQLAAHTLVISTLMNLDETITKE